MRQTQNKRRSWRGTSAVALGAIGVLALAGCGGRTIGGKVMRGEIGRVIIVSTTDERLEDEGLGGIEIEMSTPVAGRGGRSIIAKGVTDEDGVFKLNAGASKKLPTRLSIRAGGEGEYEVRNSIFRPRAGEQVLVLMRPPKSP